VDLCAPLWLSVQVSGAFHTCLPSGREGQENIVVQKSHTEKNRYRALPDSLRSLAIEEFAGVKPAPSDFSTLKYFFAGFRHFS